MANLPENPVFDAGIYQIETTDPVQGGVNGISNRQATALGNRTKYLYDRLVNAGLDGNPRETSADLDTVISPGFYLVRANATNKPVNKFGHLFVTGNPAAPDQTTSGSPDTSAAQLYIVNNSEVSEMYFRVSFALIGFGPWAKLISQTDLTAVTNQFIGMVSAFAGTSAPNGWFQCNGAAISRTTYAALFARIGTTYGSGNGSTTFNLPDLRGEFIRGLDSGRGIDPGRMVGTLQADSIRSHDHDYSVYVPGEPVVQVNTVPGGQVAVPNFQTTGATTGTGGAETRPRNVALMYCIKY